MVKTTLRWWFCAILMLLVMGMSLAAPVEQPLNDSELDAIWATGFNIDINLDLDVKTDQPGSLIIDKTQLDSLKQFADDTMQRTTMHTRTTGGAFTTDGIDLPNFSSVVSNTVNNIDISGNALQNAQSLLNIVALGDVAVGVNLVVIVNPGDTPFTITQTNINWSDIISSLTPTPSGAQAP